MLFYRAAEKILSKKSKKEAFGGQRAALRSPCLRKGRKPPHSPRKRGEKMDVIPRNDYGERCQFDAYCKMVLYHEAIDYLREMQRRWDRELSFSDLSQTEMDKLYTVDRYPSDRFTFSSHGYDLHIDNELVADAFAGLSSQEQSILILHEFVEKIVIYAATDPHSKVNRRQQVDIYYKGIGILEISKVFDTRHK